MLKFNRDFFKYFSLLGTLGFYMAGSIILFIWLYKLIAKYFIESQILFIIFVLLGVINGFYLIYNLITKK